MGRLYAKAHFYSVASPECLVSIFDKQFCVLFKLLKFEVSFFF